MLLLLRLSLPPPAPPLSFATLRVPVWRILLCLIVMRSLQWKYRWLKLRIPTTTTTALEMTFPSYTSQPRAHHHASHRGLPTGNESRVQQGRRVRLNDMRCTFLMGFRI
jgi:hypothetical protein